MAAKEPKWVVYHVASTMEVRVYKSKAAAEKCAAKKGAGYAVTSIEHYAFGVLHAVEKTSLMSGKTYTEASNTPGYMSPSSETYWSM